MSLKSRICAHPADYVGTVPAAYYIETKIDGWRAIGLGGKAPQLLTQGGAVIEGAQPFIDVLQTLEKTLGEPYMFDGELVAGADFEETSRNIRAGTLDCAVWHIFDAMPLAQWRRGGCALGYDMRRRILEQAFADRTGRSSACVIHHGPVSVALLQRAGPFAGPDVADKVFEIAREKGAEGIVIKDAEAPYANGKVSGWWRRKVRETLDLPVVGMDYNPATGLTRIMVEHQGVVTSVSGVIPPPPVAPVLATRDGFAAPTLLLAEITHLGITSTGALRSASFVRWRPDRVPPASTTLVWPTAQADKQETAHV